MLNISIVIRYLELAQGWMVFNKCGHVAPINSTKLHIHNLEAK